MKPLFVSSPAHASRVKRWAGSLSFAIALAASSATAAPTQRDIQEAQQLVVEARKLQSQGDLKQALKKYKRADQLVPQVSFKLAIGKILADLGDFVRASAALHEAMDQKPGAPAEQGAQAEAKKLLDEIDKKTPVLDVEIFKPEAAKVTLSIDDDEVEAGEHRVNPGKHEVSAKAEGYKDWHKTVRVDEGAKKSVEITMKLAGAAEGAAERDERNKSTGPLTVPKWAAWSTWGLTAASLGIAAGFGIVAIQTTNSVLNDYNCQNGKCPGPGHEKEGAQAQADLDVAKVNGNVSTAFFVIAGVSAVGASMLTYFAYRKSDKVDDEKSDALVVRPLFGPGVAGVTGTF